MEHGKVRVILFGHTAAASKLLQHSIASDRIFLLCGDCNNWEACQDLLEEHVPDVLIARRGVIPAAWEISSTPLLWVAESPTLDAVSASTASDGAAGDCLRKELSEIYGNVLNEKAQQLRSLLQFYQQSISSKPYVAELKVRRDGTELSVPVQHVEWIEGAGNWVNIHTPQGVYPLREMIHEVLEKLPDPQFVRIHRSAVVNRSRITEVRFRNDVPIALTMQSGVSLSVGLTFREPLRENRSFQAHQAIAS